MKLLPMKMHPFYTEYLWGGKLLKTCFNKTDAPEITAESWELSANPDGLSFVEDGIHKGKTLNMMYEEDNTIFGTQVHGDYFPLLIKLIDANRDLSIQVHPSDKTAIKEIGENGKEEVWFIIDSQPDSSIYFGFSKDTCKEEVRQKIADGTICEILNKVPVKKGDVFLIKPGTVHAIGAGNLIAEIQQNSNTTFRVFDFNRKDSNGKMRALHIDRALSVLNYKKTTVENQSQDECISEYFKVKVFNIDTKTDFFCGKTSFEHLLCVQGSLTILFEGETFALKTGESYFIPSGMGQYSIEGHGKLLVSSVPDLL